MHTKGSIGWPRKKSVKIIRLPGGPTTDTVVLERPITVYVNDQHAADLRASPADLRDLATGHLYVRKVINQACDIDNITITGLTIHTTITPKPYTPPPLKEITASAADLCTYMQRLLAGAKIHHVTGGTHCSAIISRGRLIHAREDVGRHNAIDKTIGAYLSCGDDKRNIILMSTGRVNTDTAEKAVRLGVPIMVSRSAPTEAAIELLSREGITLVGFVRQQRVNVYTHPQRVTE